MQEEDPAVFQRITTSNKRTFIKQIGYPEINFERYNDIKKPKLRSIARFAESFLSYHCASCKTDFVKIKQNFLDSKDDENLSKAQQAICTYYAAYIQYHGLAGKEDYYSARSAFSHLKDNEYLSLSFEKDGPNHFVFKHCAEKSLERNAFSLFYLACMKYRALGGPENKRAAKVVFLNLKDSKYLGQKEKDTINNFLNILCSEELEYLPSKGVKNISAEKDQGFCGRSDGPLKIAVQRQEEEYVIISVSKKCTDQVEEYKF